ncbi:MAG TPA: hypothetical protein PLC25_01330 [Bacilli bacterium]|nr:hypothetical protein [Bacilli bacterium]
MVKFKLGLIFMGSHDDNCLEIDIDEEPDTYDLNFMVSSVVPLKDFLDSNFEIAIKDNINMMIHNNDFSKKEIEELESLLGKNLDVYNNIIEITSTDDDLLPEFIKFNKLEKREILLTREADATHNNLNELFSRYKDFNIYVLVDGNSSYIPLLEYKKTVDAIDSIVNKINKYNLSELEKVMYAFDLVRDRVYVSEEDNEDMAVSRDLSSVLFGDKIVCVGFSEIFDKVLRNLGINSQTFRIVRKDNSDIGHQRDVVYINDPKYGVEGIYFFDPTWNCKENKDDNNFLNSYDYFCQPKESIDSLSDDKYNDETWKGICDDNKKLLEDKIKHDDLIHITERILKPYNLVAKFIDGKDLINAFLSYRRIPYAPVGLTGVYDQNDVLNRLEKYNRLINCDFITPDNFLKLVYNVRKVEYYDDPEKYPFSIEAIKKCVVDSSAYYDVRALLFSIFDKSFSNKMSENEFDMKVEDIELEKKIGQVKLTRTLKNFSQKKR